MEEEQCVRHSGFLHTTVSLALTHNNSDSQLFIEPESNFLSGRQYWKNVNQSHLTLITLQVKVIMKISHEDW